MLALHGQLAPLAWAFAPARPATRRLGYVQTAGGALPGGHSCVVRELRDDGLLAGHLTAGPAFGGADGEAITTAAALHHGLTALGWDAAVAGPGPGILGSGSALGHGGLQALDSAHTALALGCPTLLVARMSSTDLRARHRGLSHHTRTVLDLLLAPVVVARARRRRAGRPTSRHDWRALAADLDGYAASGLPTRSMGREDPLFFAAALAAGTALARDATSDAMSDERIEPLGGETVFEGSQFTVRVERFRHADGEEVEREIVRRDGRRRRSSPTTTSTSGSCASRARRSCAVHARAAGRQARRRGRVAAADRPARARRGDRPRGRRLGGGRAPSTPRRGYTDEVVHIFAATGLRDSRRRARPRRADRDRRAGRWPTSTRALAATTDAKTLIGLQWLRATLG